MQLFSEDYLMHYGIKGMKWKKKKTVSEPEKYLNDAYRDEYGYHLRDREGDDINGKDTAGEYVRRRVRKRWTEERRVNDKLHDSGIETSWKQRDNRVKKKANAARREDIKAAREDAYKRNQKRIKKQQHKAKVKNAVKRIKNKVFVDTSGKQKVGNLYVSHETHLGR